MARAPRARGGRDRVNRQRRLDASRIRPVGARPERRLHLSGRPASRPARRRPHAAHLAHRRHGLPRPARHRGETPHACPRPVRAGGGPAPVAVAAAPADCLPGRGGGRGGAGRLPRTPRRRAAAGPHRHGAAPGLRADRGRPRHAHPRAVRGRGAQHDRVDRASRDRALQPGARRPGARRRHPPARLRRPVLLLARTPGAALRPPAALLPSARRGWRDGRLRRRGGRRLLRESGPRHGAVAARRTPARAGRSLRGRGNRARRGAAPGRLPLHVGEPGADRGLRHHRLPRRSRRSADPALRPASPPPASSRCSTWAPICRAWRCGSRMPADSASPGAERDAVEPAVRVGARRPAVLPQPRARQLPGAAAGGGELAADRPARSAAPRRLVLGPVAARRGGRPAADRGRVRGRRQPRGGPAVEAAVRLRPQRVAPAAHAAGHALRRRRDARPRAACDRPRRSSTTRTSCRRRPGACRRSSTRSSTPTPPTIRRRRSPGSASISARWWRAPPPTSSSSPIAARSRSRSTGRPARSWSTATRSRSST